MILEHTRFQGMHAAENLVIALAALGNMYMRLKK